MTNDVLNVLWTEVFVLLSGLPPSPAMGSSELPFAGTNQEPFVETKPSFNLEQG